MSHELYYFFPNSLDHWDSLVCLRYNRFNLLRPTDPLTSLLAFFLTVAFTDLDVRSLRADFLAFSRCSLEKRS